jgi:hypothetical protein
VLVDGELDDVVVSIIDVDVVEATVVLVETVDVVVLGSASVVVVVGREGGGGSGGRSKPRSGNSSWEQSTGSPVRPSTNEQYNSWHPVKVVLDRITAKHMTPRRSRWLFASKASLPSDRGHSRTCARQSAVGARCCEPTVPWSSFCVKSRGHGIRKSVAPFHHPAYRLLVLVGASAMYRGGDREVGSQAQPAASGTLITTRLRHGASAPAIRSDRPYVEAS